MIPEQETPQTEQNPTAPEPTPAPESAEANPAPQEPPARAAETSPAPPPAAETVLAGRETEETANLKRKLEGQQSALLERERRLAEREDAFTARQQRTLPRAELQKRAWLSGNSLVD